MSWNCLTWIVWGTRCKKMKKKSSRGYWNRTQEKVKKSSIPRGEVNLSGNRFFWAKLINSFYGVFLHINMCSYCIHTESWVLSLYLAIRFIYSAWTHCKHVLSRRPSSWVWRGFERDLLHMYCRYAHMKLINF